MNNQDDKKNDEEKVIMKKILVIEDDSFLNSLISAKLAQSGFDLTSSIGGKDGLEKLKIDKFDLVLLDILLPDLNGLDLLRQVKKEQAAPINTKTPVVILSNFSEEDRGAQGRELGAIDYLVKASYTPDEVVERVKKIMDKQ